MANQPNRNLHPALEQAASTATTPYQGTLRPCSHYYFGVVISGRESRFFTRTPISAGFPTFKDLRHRIEEELIEDGASFTLPYTNFQFSDSARGRRRLSPLLEGKVLINDSVFNLTKQGDGTIKNKYLVFIYEDDDDGEDREYLFHANPRLFPNVNEEIYVDYKVLIVGREDSVFWDVQTRYNAARDQNHKYGIDFYGHLVKFFRGWDFARWNFSEEDLEYKLIKEYETRAADAMEKFENNRQDAEEDPKKFFVYLMQHDIKECQSMFVLPN